jgi:tetratricopeptide (TPR) repeat protein
LGRHADVAERFTAHPRLGWEAVHRRGYPGYSNWGYGYGGAGWTISADIIYVPDDSVYGGHPDYGPPPPLVDPPACDPGHAAPPQSTVIFRQTLAEHEARFPARGEDAFEQADYEAAAYYWRHALLDDPENPMLMVLLGQALFAVERFDEAAGATQAAMHRLPKELWGIVVAHHAELYGDDAEYTRQLQALERAAAEKSKSPARHFLLGFHYAYLGFPQPALRELDKALHAEPRDEIARQLQQDIQSRLQH